MQKYTITRNLPNFCVHIFVLPAFSLSFSIKILIFVQSYLFLSTTKGFFKDNNDYRDNINNTRALSCQINVVSVVPVVV